LNQANNEWGTISCFIQSPAAGRLKGARMGLADSSRIMPTTVASLAWPKAHSLQRGRAALLTSEKLASKLTEQNELHATRPNQLPTSGFAPHITFQVTGCCAVLCIG
jgi:hypothetical protein